MDGKKMDGKKMDRKKMDRKKMDRKKMDRKKMDRKKMDREKMDREKMDEEKMNEEKISPPGEEAKEKKLEMKISKVSDEFNSLGEIPPFKSHISKDLSQYLKLFFPRLNGITPCPVEGKNFTKETLTYMSPAARAKEVVTELLYIYGSRPFIVVEPLAGIGGNTLSFLACPQIKHVVAWEQVSERREMLKRNIEMYKFINKCTIMDGAFNSQDLSKFTGCALFMDPPWLPNVTETSEGKFDKGSYILSGIKVGTKTIEEWLNFYSGVVSVFIGKFPPGYILNSVPGWHIKYRDQFGGADRKTVKARLYIAVRQD